jgi:IS5 family transposase
LVTSSIRSSIRSTNLSAKFKTTTASVHDSQIGLSEINEVIYRTKNICTNERISEERVPGEKVYLVVKEVFKAWKVLVTTMERVNVKMLMKAFCFNLCRMKTLKTKGII